MSIRSSYLMLFASVVICVGPADAVAADYVFAPIGNSTRRDLPANWVPYGGPSGPNDREVPAGTGGSVGSRTASAAEIPDGFELVWITDDPDLDDQWAEINNCGEIVFVSSLNNAVQIRLYDNGQITQLTADDGIQNRFPDINNNGTIVWQHDWDELSLGDMVVWDEGNLTVVGRGYAPVINDIGQMAWMNRYDVGCFGGDGDVFLYDEGNTIQLTEEFLSNQLPRINNSGEVVWTHYDFCPVPWRAYPGYYDGAESDLLPTSQEKAQVVDISNKGKVAWGGDGGIEIWQDGTTSLLTDWGRNPRLNEVGDVAFLRFQAGTGIWQVWLYSNDQYFQISDDGLRSTWSAINDYGEIVHTSGEVSERVLRLMRRIRDGDTDFDNNIGDADFSPFPDCATGPFDADRLCECRFLDMDYDRDVDLGDFALFANAFGELQHPEH